MRATRMILLAAATAAVVIGGGGAARAEEPPQLSAKAPLAGLPAVSADGAAFARPVRVQPAGCKGVQSFVELGQFAAARGDATTRLLMVGDDCGTAGAAMLDKNLAAVNETLRKGYRRVAAAAGADALPAELTVGPRTVRVSTADGRVTVAVAGSRPDQWTLALDGAALAARGAYEAVGPDGKPYLAVLLAVAGKDTGARGRERWVDFWPVGGAGEPDGPIAAGARFIDALIARDADAIADAITAPFWRVGLAPAGSKACKASATAKKAKDLAAAARCMAGAPGEIYGRFGRPADQLVEITIHDFPDELRAHKKAVQKLLRKEHKMVRWRVHRDGVHAVLVMLLDPDSNYQTVSAALEAITSAK